MCGGDSWTLAYRRPHANRFSRVSDWSGSWDEASARAGVVSRDHPEFEVWFVPTAGCEASGMVCADDIGNILVSSGRRVRMTDDGSMRVLGPVTRKVAIRECHPDGSRLTDHYSVVCGYDVHGAHSLADDYAEFGRAMQVAAARRELWRGARRMSTARLLAELRTRQFCLSHFCDPMRSNNLRNSDAWYVRLYVTELFRRHVHAHSYTIVRSIPVRTPTGSPTGEFHQWSYCVCGDGMRF